MNNTYIAIDEFDDLENIGENSTVDQAMLNNISKIQAVNYVHRGYCSPNDTPDEGSDIILHVVEANKPTMTTRCRLYYKLLKGSQRYVQLLGFVDIYVGHIIKNWKEQKIEDIYYKQYKTKKEHDKLDKWAKKDWYIYYQIRKKEKIDMINKLGIFRTKDLDYSDIYLQTVRDLMIMTKMKGGINTKRIKNHVKMLCRQNKIPTTLLGDQVMAERPEGILTLYADQQENLKRLQIYKTKNYKAEIQITQQIITQLGTEAQALIDELEFLVKIKKKYYDE